jgi:hypothetical protein
MPAPAPAYVRLDELFFRQHFAEIPDATLETRASIFWRHTDDLLLPRPLPARFADAILTEQVNAIWQAEMFELYGRKGGRGEPTMIKPIDRRPKCRSGLRGPEWIVVTVLDNDLDDYLCNDRWENLYLRRKDAAMLVAEVKRSLGLPVPTPPQQPQDTDGIEPELRALADRIFDHLVHRYPPPSERPTRDEWVGLAIDKGWETNKAMIFAAYRIVFESKNNRPPKGGWALTEHYERKWQDIMRQ